METWLLIAKRGCDEWIFAFDTKKEAYEEKAYHGGEVVPLSDFDKQGQADILNGGISFDFRKEVIN